MTDGIEEEDTPQESLLPEGVEDDLRTRFGNLLVFEVDHLGVFAFKRATQATNDRLIDKMTDDKNSKSAAIREFAASSQVWPRNEATDKPDWAKVTELFAYVPHLPQDLLQEIRDLSPKVDLKKR